MNISRHLVPFAVGIVFAIGLGIAGMTLPEKIIGFLDVLQTRDAWDPTLLFVMGGAVITYALVYWVTESRAHPLLASAWQVPKRRDLTPRLVAGAILFGAGWGLSGFCPGPALTSTVTGNVSIFVFVGSMTGGMYLFQVYESIRSRQAMQRTSSTSA